MFIQYLSVSRNMMRKRKKLFKNMVPIEYSESGWKWAIKKEAGNEWVAEIAWFRWNQSNHQSRLLVKARKN